MPQSMLKKITARFSKVQHRCVLAFFLLLWLGTHVFADSGLTSILEQSDCDPEHKFSIEQIFYAAQQQGIPPAMLYPKLKEGLAKHAPCGRLVEALKHELTYLLEARDILLFADKELDIDNEQALWLRTSILLAKGFSGSVIRELAVASRSSWDDYREATVVFVNLTQWGLSVSSALTVVKLLLSSRIPTSDFSGIITIFIEGRKLFISPQEIIRRIREIIPSVNSIVTLEERVIY
jgi:hypothetical protein